MMRPTEERLGALGGSNWRIWMAPNEEMFSADRALEKDQNWPQGRAFQEGWACRKAPSMFEKL